MSKEKLNFLLQIQILHFKYVHMKFAFIVTYSVFLDSEWIKDNVNS